MAQFNLGSLYAEGLGVAQDYGKARVWFEKAAAQGEVLAQYSLGVLYEHGLSVRQSYGKACTWYEKAAIQGYAPAQSNLGVLYMKSSGVAQNYNKAREWFEKAATQSYAEAQHNLGILYEDGQGIEPLSPQFDGDWLYAATRRRASPIKPLLMDSHVIVGIGNIYAAESLFLAGVSPLRRADRLSRAQCLRLAEAVRTTLLRAIVAGGSSVRDYVHSDGGAGGFQIQCAVYDRAGAPCIACGQPVRRARQSGRSSFYCPHCQK